MGLSNPPFHQSTPPASAKIALVWGARPSHFWLWVPPEGFQIIYKFHTSQDLPESKEKGAQGLAKMQFFAEPSNRSKITILVVVANFAIVRSLNHIGPHWAPLDNSPILALIEMARRPVRPRLSCPQLCIGLRFFAQGFGLRVIAFGCFRQLCIGPSRFYASPWVCGGGWWGRWWVFDK